MGQPVRQIIKDLHPEILVKPFYTLIIDGNNLLRQSMADTKVNLDGIHYGGIFQFLLQIKLLLKQYPYEYVYIVFDDSDSGIIRYKIYNEYKANRDKKYAIHLNGEDTTEYWNKLEATIKSIEKSVYNKNKKKKEKTDEQKLVDENFDRERNILIEYCEELFIRVLFDTKTEGDDFIAYYVNHKKPEEKIVIVSTDQDLTQLISPTVAVYNRMTKKYLSVKNFKDIKGYPIENVVLRKIFCGDTSDNIGNIKGVSENRLMELMPEIKERPVTIEEVKERAKSMIEERIKENKKPLQWHENIVNGVPNKKYDGDFYEINDKLINLKHPLLTKEAEETIESMMYAPMDPEGRSFTNLYEMIKRDGIEDLMNSSSFSSFFIPFKELSDREIKRYKEEN